MVASWVMHTVENVTYALTAIAEEEGLDVALKMSHALSVDERTGLTLAVSSSIFIGASFVITKTGLSRAGADGVRASGGGYGYLWQPLWWAGLLTMAVGEAANFLAYAYAPPMLVTPLGALSIISSALLADRFLGEKLNLQGWFGCVLCIGGSVVVVAHAPSETNLSSIDELWDLAGRPAFVIYAAWTLMLAIALAAFDYHFTHLKGKPVLVVLVAICSLVGSMSVMSCKVLGICVRLLLGGHANWIDHPESGFIAILVAVFILVQMNYLNKALDAFSTAVVSPVYYVLFTSMTLTSSFVLFREWERTTLHDVCYAGSGFATTIAGVFLLVSVSPVHSKEGRASQAEKIKALQKKERYSTFA